MNSWNVNEKKSKRERKTRFKLICLPLQRPLLINYNAGILMNNGQLWNIHKIARYGDTYMILDRNVLKFTGNLLIEKVNVSL